MSAIRSALDEWVSEDDYTLSIDQLADDIVELEIVSEMVETIRLRKLNAFHRRGGLARTGHASLTSYLIDRCRMAAGRARRLVSLANAARTASMTFVAWQDGRISTGQAQRLLDVSQAVPDAYPEAEAMLIDAVQGLTVSDTNKAVEYWRQAVDGPELSIDQELIRRGVSLSRTILGMSRLGGWMTTTAAEAMFAVFDALMPPPTPDDTRTPRQRRHDALEDLARNLLENTDTPTVGGEKPHINIVCDLDALAGIAGGLHETERGDVLTVDTIRALACDSSVSRIVLGPESEIIDVGRRTRVIPAATRRAVIARDRHCVWPGCDREPRHCDVHHKVH